MGYVTKWLIIEEFSIFLNHRILSEKWVGMLRIIHLFCGNHEAAQNTAVICSLLTSCKESGVNPREWLNDVISKMPYLQKPGNDEALKALLPNRWEKEKSNNTLIIR